MPRPEPLYQWADRVATHFPGLSTCQARVLALYSFGMVLARSSGLDRVALHLAASLGQGPQTVRQRLREFYRPAASKRGRSRRQLEPADCFAPLLGWVLAGWGCRRLALAIDATALGRRLTVLSVAVVYRGCAVPVAWAVLPGNEPGAWNPHWIRLLGALAAALDPTWRVVVLSDRGIESSELFRAIVGLGWHPLMRVKAAGCFRPDGWRKWWRLSRFAPRVGCRGQLRGRAYKKASARLDCTLMVRWDEGHREAWLVLTDLAPQAADAAWYALRSWVEQSFKVVKSGGWRWQETRMSDPARAERLWAALALATLWLLELGGVADAAIRPETIPACAAPRRRHSVFRQGQAALAAALLGGTAPAGRFRPQAWPEPADCDPPPLEASMEIDTSP